MQDLESVTPAEAHAFEKNGARGRIAVLLLHLLSADHDAFLESLAGLSPSAPPGKGRNDAKASGQGDVLVEFLHAIVGDGAFVLEDALGRLADIRAIQVCVLCSFGCQ